MPIKDLTDKPREDPPRLGQLRKGAKKTHPKKPGEDLTYFRFESDDPELKARFEAAYGDKPRVINVGFLFTTVEETFPTWREEHGAGGMKHRCDGETMVLWQDESGQFSTKPKPCPYADLPKGSPERKCKPSGELYVTIPELGYRWAYVRVVTGSIWDCLELTNNLVAVEMMAQRASVITGRPIDMRGIPCLLKREPRMISTPSGSDGQRVRREKWLLHLEISPAYIEKLVKSIHQYSLPVVDLPQLEAPEDLSLDYDPYENGDSMIEGEYTEAPESVMSPIPQQEPQDNGDNEVVRTSKARKAKIALVAGMLWNAAATKLAQDCPHYQHDDKPNFDHMLTAAANLGYSEITADNLEQVIRELADRVEASAEAS